MKIATFNVNSIRKRVCIVLDWLAQHKPDVLCLQETKVQDSDFPIDAFARSGYHVTYRGMRSYNGVAVLSRTTPELVSSGLGQSSNGEDHARLLRVVVQGLPIINTYIPQ
ncbi:MAG: exodeoxyribonuclease III, partial [Nitrospirales bacterium]|nr:exodeoxyribonuclease III [Nitrospirales bacterium]